MATDPFHIAELITAYLQGTLSADQRAELDTWLKLDANKQFFEELSEKNNFRERLTQFAGVNAESTWNKTLIGLMKSKQNKTAPASTFSLFNYKWAAGAAALLALCLSVYLFSPFSDRNANDDKTRIVVVNDVAPGTKGATLTLANGKTIGLSGNKGGILTNTGNIVYDDGTPVDTSLQQGTKMPSPVNMLLAATANGKTYVFTLPDGTKVWLNAASSIRFPAAFAGERRKVEITGEAYLEVFKDKAHPFVVVSKDQQVVVLGTHFNIRSYPEESSTKTTLLEGSVKITTASDTLAQAVSVKLPEEIILKPNQQSVLRQGNIKVQPANTEMETAWIKNDFYFRGESLESVVRDVARWYDVKITYTDEKIKSIPLIGQISRTRPLSAVLERIASAGRIRFKIEGKQVTVMPDNK